MWPKWPRIMLLLVIAAPLGTLSENPGDTTPSHEEEAFGGSTSPSTTPSPKPEDTTDRLINGDLRKAARVEPMSGSGQKRGEEEQYDVVDVMAATGAGTGSGRPKSGQTTRIYTTGEVDESFWLKHLGDDFKHAIHLQVGGTNEEYNRLINRTQNGVHEEVHHEYLPGAERPNQGGYSRRNQQQQQQQQQSFDRRSLAMKQQYLIHQQAQQQMERYNYAQQHSQHYTPQPQQHTQQYPQHPQQQQQQHTQHHQQQQHQYPETHQYRPNTYQKPQNQGYIINSSEDQLHASQSNPAPVRSVLGGGGGGAGGQEEVEGDSFDSQLNFKSPFNDYGSRPTRDLTYLLYRRGL